MKSYFNAQIVLWCLVAPLVAHGESTVAEHNAKYKAETVSMLADGNSLLLDKSGLRVIDAKHRVMSAHSLRAKHLDVRPLTAGFSAWTFDVDLMRPVEFTIDVRQGRLRMGRQLPAPEFDVAAICMYRDVQKYDYLFLIGKDGQSEQWLLSGDKPRLYRKLSLPVGTRHCRIDDDAHLMFLNEKSMGIWAYRVDGEQAPQRHAVALFKPHGRLSEGSEVFDALPGGVAILDQHDRKVMILRNKAGRWIESASVRVNGKGEHDRLVVAGSPDALSVLLRSQTGEWSVYPIRSSFTRPAANALPLVKAAAQTDPVSTVGDSADDPAIWVHPVNAEKSLVIGTNKKFGLLVYDLNGKQRQSLPIGRLNNVDVRQNVRFGDRRVDLAIASNRDKNTLDIFEIDANGLLSLTSSLPTPQKQIYGICLYQPVQGGLSIFANDKDGRVAHFHLEWKENRYSANLIRTIEFESQVEGCVVDDRNARMFIGEEKRGVWTIPIDGTNQQAPQIVLPVGADLKADVEGLALYHGERASYLVVSSQGNNSYVVIDAQPPFRYRGAFRIGLNAEEGIDGTSETDGIEVTSARLGQKYRDGMLVVQDGIKRLPDGRQNFKYVSWSAVAAILGLE